MSQVEASVRRQRPSPRTVARGWDSDQALSRRGAFHLAAAAAAFWGAASRARAQPIDVPADVDPGSVLNKLVRRITLGHSEAELARAQSLGYQAYLEYHLAYTAIDDSAVAARVAPLTTLTMTPQQLFPINKSQIIAELVEATMVRSIFSNRQLYQRMVEFWTDHFNIDILNPEDDGVYKTPDDRDVIRANALGTFPALVDASAHSPAMLHYLNNDQSTVGMPNENYGRELMELHTMGVDGGYTQTDVEQVARCFTGWTIYSRTSGAQSGTFRFNAALHDTGQKTVLGHVIPPRTGPSGIQDGLDVINILVNHPSTARFIAKKLCRWLLSETPSPSALDAVAATYTATTGDVKAMIRTALAPNVLAAAPAKYKRPYHHMISTLRALPTTYTTGTATASLRNQMLSTGHHPFYWSSPDGYPDRLDYWIGLVVPRWNFGASLLNGTAGSIGGVTIDTNAFFAGLTTTTQLIDRINIALFGGEMPQSDRDQLTAYLAVSPGSATRRRETLGLAVGSPGFQWY